MIGTFGKEKITVRLLRVEIQHWTGFAEVLKGDARTLGQEMIEMCMKYVGAVQESGEE